MRPRPTTALLSALLTLVTVFVCRPAIARDSEPTADAEAPAQTDLPAVAAQLPAAFDSAILVPDLGALDGGLAGFGSASGLDLGELQDVVGRFQRELGLMDGLDDGGSLAVVVIEAGAEPLAVMLLPVTDYAALSVSLGGNEGAVVDVTLPDGTAGVLRDLGDGYAVLGGNRRVVEAYTPSGDAGALAERVGPEGAGAVRSAQLAFVMNTATMDDDGLTAELTSYAAQVLRHADAMLAVDLAPGPMMHLLGSFAQMISVGTDAAVVGLSFGANGIAYTEAYRLNGETGLADLFPGQGNSADAASVLAKLPDDRVVMAIAGDPGAIGFAEWTDRLGGLVVMDARHALGTAKPAAQALLQEANAVATAYYALPDASQAVSRWMNTVTVFEVDDAERFAETLEEMILSLNDAEVPIAGAGASGGTTDTNGADANAVTFETTYKAEDRLLGGVRYDTFTFKAVVPQALRNTPMNTALAALGEIGFTGQAAVIDGHVVVTTFDDLNTIERVLRSVASGNGLGAGGGLQSLLGSHLPGGHAAVGVLDLRGVADTMQPFFAFAGNADPANVDAETEPILFAMDAGDDSASFRMFLPTSAIDAMIDEDFEPNLRGDDTPDEGRGGRGGRDTPGGLGPRDGRPNTNPGRDRDRDRDRSRPGSRPGRGTPGRAPR